MELVRKIDERYSIYYSDKLNNIGEFEYYIFDEKSIRFVANCLCSKAKNKGIIKNNELYITAIKVFDKGSEDSILDVIDDNGETYKGKGFGTILINQLVEHAKAIGKQRLVLWSISENSDKFYWANGFVYNNNHLMYKEVDEKIWLYAVVLNECMSRALENKTTVKKELNLMLKNKDYDNLFEYNIIKEDYKNKDYNPKVEFLKFDKMLKNKVKNDNVFKLALTEVQKCVDGGKCYASLKEFYDMNIETNTFLLTDEKRKEIKDVRNICADIYLIKTDKLYYEEKYINNSENNQSMKKK